MDAQLSDAPERQVHPTSFDGSSLDISNASTQKLKEYGFRPEDCFPMMTVGLLFGLSVRGSLISSSSGYPDV